MSTNSPNEAQPAERVRPMGSSRVSPQALFEAHLDVRDLDRSLAFYREVVGLELAHRQDDRRVAFLWIGGRGCSMLGLWEGGASPNCTSLHIAFAIELDAVLSAPTVLRAAGVEPLDFDRRSTDEAWVFGWMPAAAVFFRDPDGHLLEYLAMLPDEPRPEAGVVPYSEWTSRWAPWSVRR